MAHPKKILFSGKKDLAGHCLAFIARLHGSQAIAAVLKQEDDRFYDLHGTPCDAVSVAGRLGVPVIAPSEIDSTEYDTIVSVLGNTIFTPAQLRKAVVAAINLHPAPLPCYRGSYGRTFAIVNGDTTYGSTIHHMDEKTDRGDIILNVAFPIYDFDTASTLDERTRLYSLPLFCEAWSLLLRDEISPRRQDQSDARYYKISAIDALLERPLVRPDSDQLLRLSRGLQFPPRLTPPDWLVDMLAETTPRDSKDR
ncbi:hypothetical protein HFO97_18565 [Rhizobium leguminosarum]|uniref:formyltransferase family protein n=1 Tax=Rhizobium leguminosarum TaxID=384 RepID=UPI001C97869C|nr:formyltransferase family protein [Rhizobium leguminosarum]MBY5361916.1 hypothetical protein [Rhizobium leguminosarum]